MHNYCCIRDIKLFASEATDKFMGKTMNDTILEGNPFLWASNDWELPEDFQVCNDFPGLSVWEANMTAGALNLCFRHEKSKSNLEKLRLEKKNEKDKNENSEEKDDVEEGINEYEKNEQNEADYDRRRVHRMITDEFPQAPHHILIAESLRQFIDSLTTKLVEENPNFRTTDTYRNNKKSLRFVLEQLSSSRFAFHHEVCSILYAFPLKSTDTNFQVSNINDCIRTIRNLGSGELKFLPYVKTNFACFDNSQDTLGSDSQKQVYDTKINTNKSTRSCD